MSHARRSTTAGPPARAAAATGAQRRHAADDLELAIRDAEHLARDFRRGARDARELHDFEERAQAIAQAIIAPFRGTGAKPVHAPLYVSPNGLQAIW